MSGFIHHASEDDFGGLPEPLPAGEQILWSGAPDWKALARTAFHTNVLLVYFSAILIARGATIWSTQHVFSDSLIGMLWLTPLVIVAMAVLYTVAFLTARTTRYTITTRRVIMHIGVVLDITLNLPFEAMAGASLKLARDGSGDIPLALLAPNKIAFVHLWPHARPWKLAQPEPMLRSVPNAANVGGILTRALAAAIDGKAAAVPRPVPARQVPGDLGGMIPS